jgi:UDP-glucose:(heptosyl)LPS alpha-1,3-glucosyltransferase
MRIAFAIMKLFPGGGLQRDCVEIARHCRQRGHDVVIFTSFKDESDFADDLAVAVLPIRQGPNHRMLEEFATSFRWAAAVQQFDLAVGFDKLTHLDVLYCADPSVYFRMRKERFRFLIPRYRSYLALERATFEPGRRTKVLVLSETQLTEYRDVWHTSAERLALLPPTVSSGRRCPQHRRNGMRDARRADFGFTPRDWVWIAIGVQPHTKGFDRTVRALRQFPNAKLLVVGLVERSTRAAAALAARAKRLKVADRISFLGHREDIPDVMAAADLLVHPARHDTTGTVILEAVVNGLPVVTTSVCGYARHVIAAEAGLVVDAPFDSRAFAAALSVAADAARRSRWSASAEQYGAQPFLYDGRMRAAEMILGVAAERVRRKSPGAAGAKPASGEVIYLGESGRGRGASSGSR